MPRHPPEVVPPTVMTCGSPPGAETQPRLPEEATSTAPRRAAKFQGLLDDRDRHLAAEVEAHVDDVGAVLGGEADAACDVVGVALAGLVEDADRHQLRAVGQPGQGDAVVRLLADVPGDVGAVAVDVVGEAVVVDEARPCNKALAAKVGAAASSLAAVAVGDAGVEDGDGDAGGAGPAGAAEVSPGGDRVDPTG